MVAEKACQRYKKPEGKDEYYGGRYVVNEGLKEVAGVCHGKDIASDAGTEKSQNSCHRDERYE